VKLDPLRREPFSINSIRPPPPSLNPQELQAVAQRLHNTSMLKHQSRFDTNPRSVDVNYLYKMPSSAVESGGKALGHLYKF
jgi:hypothetical protein